jgi:hypothetical protein
MASVCHSGEAAFHRRNSHAAVFVGSDGSIWPVSVKLAVADGRPGCVRTGCDVVAENSTSTDWTARLTSG